jgi:hypothetical protein
MSRGICYVAWGEKGLKEAYFSAKHNASGYPTCLITDQATLQPEVLKALFSPGFEEIGLRNTFDQVIRVDFHQFDAMEPNPPHPHNFWRKQAFMIFSPFTHTCYLDADCIPVGDLSLGFELAEEGNFCNVIAPTMWFNWNGKQYVLYNGGVMFAPTPSPEIVDVFRQFIPTVGQDYWGDEGVISVACREGKFKHAVLPKSFNLPISGHRVNERIRVIHTRHLVGFPPTHISTDYWGNEIIER